MNNKGSNLAPRQPVLRSRKQEDARREAERKIMEPHVAYWHGRTARATGLAHVAPEGYDWCLKHWWYAGYNDLLLEQKCKTESSERYYHK